MFWYHHLSNEVEVVSKNVKLVMDGCKQELGLKKKYGLPGIKSKKVSNLTGMEASYVPADKSIHSSPITPEHGLFHELVHYLMDEEDLLINESLTEDSYLVDYPCAHLIDETIAELATSNNFSYDTENPQMFSNPLADEINRLQTAYLAGENDLESEQLEDLILGLQPSIFDNPDYRQAIRLVAIDNALKLREKGMSSSELVVKLRDAKKESSQAHQLYFMAIVDNL